MRFSEKLNAAWESNRSLMCVGLDTDLRKIPPHLRGEPEAVFAFNRAIIEATSDLVCAYKPQLAFYNAQNTEAQLTKTIAFIRETCPGIAVILDAKRGDIGNTAELYAEEAYDRYDADAVTVNPYMGGDTLEPFLRREDRGVVILCRTSNPGARDLQDLQCGDEPLYRVVARKATNDWNKNGNVMLVVGATFPDELAAVREIAGNMPLLVPGVGAQGGDTEAVVKHGVDGNGTGLVINSSRGILYAGAGKTFADDARRAAEALRDEINRARGIASR